jgi:hypothetical protein
MINGENLLCQLNAHGRVLAIQSYTQLNAVTAEQLSWRWNIGLEKV